MSQNKLFRKFVLTFLLLILTPIMLVWILLIYYAGQAHLKNEMVQNYSMALQVVNSVQRQVELAENMCSSIVENQSLTNFLEKKYESSTDLVYYCTTVQEFVKVTNSRTDIPLKIYMENESIPIGFGIFYRKESLEFTDSIREFYQSKENTIWLDQYHNALTETAENTCSSNLYYLQKIKNADGISAIVEATVPVNLFTIQDEMMEAELKPEYVDGHYIYNFSSRPMDYSCIKDLTDMDSEESTVYNSNQIYSRRILQKVPFDLIVVTPRNPDLILLVSLSLLFPGLFICMIIGFLAYNRRLIRDIQFCLNEMERAIKNDFALTPSSEYKSLYKIIQRNDEISVMAHQIEFLLQQIRSLTTQKIQQQTAAKEAVLLALQHQINPHFLYNTMEVFSSRMELNGLYEDSDAISAFSRMLRYNMNTKDLMVTVNEEIEHVKNYIAIQKIRKIPFDIQFQIPDQIRSQQCIRFLLEPMVENCFKYRGNADPLKILISARAIGSFIEFSIQNNGQAMNAEHLAELNERLKNSPATITTKGEHIGLNNINSRLKLFYGNEYFIQGESSNEQTIFRFRIQKQPPTL